MILPALNWEVKPPLRQPLISTPRTVVPRSDYQRMIRTKLHPLHISRIKHARHYQRIGVSLELDFICFLHWDQTLFYLFYHYCNVIFITVLIYIESFGIAWGLVIKCYELCLRILFKVWKEWRFWMIILDFFWIMRIRWHKMNFGHQYHSYFTIVIIISHIIRRRKIPIDKQYLQSFFTKITFILSFYL